MPKKAVVFGSSGQLGVELVRDLNRRGYETHGFARKAIDITSRETIEQCVARIDPAVVFNAAAYNQVDLAETEPEEAFRSNALGVRNLALACRQTAARLVHFSTDYVFDGAAGRPYTEQDPTHPLSAYAVSKLGGELYAQAYLDDPLVVRTSGVFGPAGASTGRGNFIETMLRIATKGQPIAVVADFVASPTYAPVLAARSIDLYERGCAGIYHAGGGAPVSWFDYAKLIFETAGLNPERRPSSEREYRTAAKRPKFSALSNGKMEREGIEPFPPLAAAVKSYFTIRKSAQGA
jgi:dTDP-4-dehydrorhamnose reductase